MADEYDVAQIVAVDDLDDVVDVIGEARRFVRFGAALAEPAQRGRVHAQTGAAQTICDAVPVPAAMPAAVDQDAGYVAH